MDQIHIGRYCPRSEPFLPFDTVLDDLMIWSICFEEAKSLLHTWCALSSVCIIVVTDLHFFEHYKQVFIVKDADNNCSADCVSNVQPPHSQLVFVLLSKCLTVAGAQVDYSAGQWLLKNMDPLNENVVNLLQNASDDFMRTIWKDGVYGKPHTAYVC